MFEHFEFVSMKQLGQLFGATSHQIGRWLVEAGLRTKGLQPSQRAIEGGFIDMVTLDDGTQFASWHREKIIEALEKAGHCRVDCTPTEQVVGPFSVRISEAGVVEILDGRELSCCVATNKDIAVKLVRQLNRDNGGTSGTSIRDEIAAQLGL